VSKDTAYSSIRENQKHIKFKKRVSIWQKNTFFNC